MTKGKATLNATIRGMLIGLLVAPHAGAQKPPAVRQLGRIERISTDSLSSVAEAVAMPGGQILINDVTSKRLILFDSTLIKMRVVADTTSATADAYGDSWATLIAYRGDSALLIEPSTLSMLVIGSSGVIARVMAIPRPDDAQQLNGIDAMPGFDGRGRMVFTGRGGGGAYPVFGILGLSKMDARGGPPPIPIQPESSLIVRVDLATRAYDTVAAFKTRRVKWSVSADADGVIRSAVITNDPVPLVDSWAVLPSGVIAVVRGRDYHVDWLEADGRRSSSPKMSFDWQQLSDGQKEALIDSSAKDQSVRIAKMMTSLNASVASPPSGGNSGGRGGGGGGGGSTSAVSGPRQFVPTTAGRADPRDVPDYLPAFQEGALHPDADGNLWIRTSVVVKGQPVYDIVNRRGEVIDRVQLPPFRTIAGFAPGRIYMAEKDAVGIVHLERAPAGQ